MLTSLKRHTNRCSLLKVAVAMIAPTIFVVLTPLPMSADENVGNWMRHTIDDSSRGADGVRPLDVNGDGRLDLVTGWEEGGKIRVYLHPGTEAVKQRWPAVTVGNVLSPEDAVFVDLDGDGATDVVSCCEGKTLSVYAHWAPSDPGQLLDSAAWSTQPFPMLAQQQAFMFCLPMQIDQEFGPDLMIGAKSRSKSKLAATQIGWLQSPANPRRLSDWIWHPIYDAGWIMSLIDEDMDGDGDLDVLLTDRTEADRGCKWLENPGPSDIENAGQWTQHPIGAMGKEVMFAAHGDLNGDGIRDVATATHDSGLFVFLGQDDSGDRWNEVRIPMPPDTGGGKAVEICDVDLDGISDLVVTCEHAQDKYGVFWLRQSQSQSQSTETRWQFNRISGKLGIKYDLMQMIDLDGDGDRDLLTCEERAQLGVTWYENPTR
tara:strand:+ start:602808 stop:604097 length:1290 start_codon:yes stop_codon:yes gene_type:complete